MTEIMKEDPHEIMEVSPYDILVDEGLHPRAAIYELTIYEYAEALENGITLPPIDIYSDGKVYLLADGYYRLAAYKLAEFDSIPVIVHQGGRKETLIHAVGANANHGLRRTNADKEKAVMIALTDPDIQGMSDNQIAKICKVSQPFVSKIRGVLTYNGYKFETTRVCSDGRVMDVSSIGTKQETIPAPIEPEAPAVEDNNDEVTGPSDQEDQNNVGNLEPGSEDNVDADLEGGDSGEEDIVEDDETSELEANDQGLNHNVSDDEDNDLDVDDTTEPDAVEDETEPELEEDDAEIETEPEIEVEDVEEDTGSDNSENNELDGIEDINTLKSMILELTTVKTNQEKEIEIKDSYIAELEITVETLKKDNDYLQKELQGFINVKTEVSASLDINGMKEEYEYSME